jgi:hypothetical protein
VNDSSLDDLERRLEALPREAWERPVPPPAPWPVEEPAPRPGLRDRRPGPRDRLVVRPLAAAAASLVLLGAGLGAGLLLAGDDGSTGPGSAPVRVELKPVGTGPRDASGVVELGPKAGGRATVRLSGLRPSERGDFYEVWLLGEGGELVSLGSVRVPGSGSATLEDVQLPVDPRRFRFLDVSREPDDGDPGHSSDSVLRGPSA